MLNTQKDQRFIIKNLTEQLNSLLFDNQLLETEMNNNKSIVRMAKSFLSGANEAEDLIKALQTGDVSKILEITSKDPEIPNLNDIAHDSNKKDPTPRHIDNSHSQAGNNERSK